ncbi:MAG: hydrogenase maturation nickel metallochaperone HypA [Magnetospirillum sp.]|nr:hydrogenase maturation nickel metallochaperone HypA [Magnetospirillum sp.]
MHEMSLTEGVIRILEEQAEAHGFTRIKTVWLEIGELSTVVPDSMEFCFGAVARGNPLTTTTATIIPMATSPTTTTMIPTRTSITAAASPGCMCRA